ncbi:hypothetical protein LINPERPRIM_LOCUS25459 [Linum perenne]
MRSEAATIDDLVGLLLREEATSFSLIKCCSRLPIPPCSCLPIPRCRPRFFLLLPRMPRIGLLAKAVPSTLHKGLAQLGVSRTTHLISATVVPPHRGIRLPRAPPLLIGYLLLFVSSAAVPITVPSTVGRGVIKLTTRPVVSRLRIMVVKRISLNIARPHRWSIRVGTLIVGRRTMYPRISTN